MLVPLRGAVGQRVNIFSSADAQSFTRDSTTDESLTFFFWVPLRAPFYTIYGMCKRKERMNLCLDLRDAVVFVI